ncbi:hypothetical protein BDZ94DRAFT_378792 [Collybia nuda]|uniref:Uncharacterized protein n=1 Tax=Collybia nuda TaxID=64659 RepID=A0A9P6CPM3_9AGAR|nr:hypothetical protein BDZ94DRAFT_378792 [Collybia nuda]
MQFMVSTVHIGNGWRDIVEIFIENLQYPGGPAQYLETNPARPTTITAKIAVIANSFLADMILTWRLYMVWNRNIYPCIAPMVTMVTYVGLHLSLTKDRI